MWALLRLPRFRGATMQTIKTIGFDIAKSVFQVHGAPTSIFCEVGGLASYSADIKALAVQCGALVDKILKGRRPSELPVELPTRFRLIVNLQTAKAIGLD